MKIKLITMPFDVIHEPVPALGLIKASVERHGHSCSVDYFSMKYAPRIDRELYHLLSTSSGPYYLLVGEWIFAKAVGKPFSKRYFELLQQEMPGEIAEKHLAQIQSLREDSPDFLKACFDSTDWEDYDLIAFSTRHQTLNASLALARKIKAAFPRIPIVFGGLNTQLHQGQQLLRMYHAIDYVCLGEGEKGFPELLDALAEGQHPAKVPGFAVRDAAGDVHVTEPFYFHHNLDQLPVPDFDGYYRGMKTYGIDNRDFFLPYQMSRGCVWREKTGKGCAYCAVDYLNAGYRYKSSGKIFSDLKILIQNYNHTLFRFDDDYAAPTLDEALAALTREGLKIKFVATFKANVPKDYLRRIRDLGCAGLFVGIESFSDRILSLMNKGINALTNIRMLKYCRELGLSIKYFLMMGIPGETWLDIQTMVARMKKLTHLQPPDHIPELQLTNYSDHSEKPGRYGIHNKRVPEVALAVYDYEDPADLNNMVSFYAYDVTEPAAPERHLEAVTGVVEEWQEAHPQSILVYVEEGDGLRILDTRPDAEREEFWFEGLAKAIYLACNDILSKKSLDIKFAGDDRVSELLDDFVRRGLMVTDGARYLSLALDLSERMSLEGLSSLNTAKLVRLAEIAFNSG